MAVILALGAQPALAAPAPLIQLSGDAPLTLSGSVTYGAVYLDGELRLTADTTLTATTVYVGPDATVRTCWVDATSAETCSVGRSLTVKAQGAVWIVPDLALRPASSGPGGALTITGSTVALAGQVDTRGIAGASGRVRLQALQSLSLRDITASGGSVTLDGSTISVTGEIGLAGVDGGGGMLAVRAGADASLATVDASGGAGAPGGAVVIVAGDVRVLRVAVDGGASDTSGGGAGGRFAVTASGGVALAAVSVAGGRGGAGIGGAAGTVTIDTLGAVGVGEISGDGAPGTEGGVAATIDLAGDRVAVERVYGSGGVASAGGGGGGASLIVEAGGAAIVGSAYLDGGNGSPGAGGAGGTLAIGAAHADVGVVYTDGGATTGSGRGAQGGTITIEGRGGVALSHAESSGGDAGDGAGQPGGAGGSVHLSATLGASSVVGIVATSGGRGGAATTVGGRGGAAGSVVLVGLRRGRLGGVVAIGGQGGAGAAETAPGGDGGRVRWFGPGDLFDGSSIVASAGGDGTPRGSEGGTESHGAPTLVTLPGRLNATASSPSGGQLVVVESDALGPWHVLGPLLPGGFPLPKRIVCLASRIAVVEALLTPAWLGPPSVAVSIPAARSTRHCDRAPSIAVSSPPATARQLRHARWIVPLTLRSTAAAVVTRIYVSSDDDRTLIRTLLPVAPGVLAGVPITLPPWARRPGTYRIELAVRAPYGVAARVAVARLVVR